MKLGVQYYRPPFPVQKHWADDLRKIRASGIDTLQLWVTWAWVECVPGVFDFEDYDELVSLAREEGLEVILSVIAELQPHWIHRIVPGSEMIDHRGHPVVSSLREESNFGLTPGGCTENPLVWERMSNFIRQTVLHYRDSPHLAGWDAWNELRWHEQSDALVCFCPHCLNEFRKWLEHRHGSLEGLNRAWQRRYHSWDDVLPGKKHWRPFTEMMAWQRFVTWKANRHGRRRYTLIKALDPNRAVTVHAGDPSPLASGWAEAYALDRGNDWDFANDLDGVGCSSFPKLSGMDDTSFTVRVEFARSASVSAGKKLWLSEVQGGRGALGFQSTTPVLAKEQQRWIWRGFAGGADKLLFWCWRDEVFGRESAGFGMAGNDGQADARLAAMRVSGETFSRNAELLANYEPDEACVGVLFSPSSYYLHWALEGNANTPRKALEGYCRAFVRRSIPYIVVEENHLDILQDSSRSLKTLFLPRMIVASEKLEQALAAFVRGGGTLVCESECGAFTEDGFFREPSDRFFTRLKLFPAESCEVGRRDLPDGGIIKVGNLSLPTRQWTTPWKNFPTDGEVWAENSEGVLIGEVALGERGGRIIHVGAYLGDANVNESSKDFEEFILRCIDSVPASIRPMEQQSSASWFIKTGKSGANRIACLFMPEQPPSRQVFVPSGFFSDSTVIELITKRMLDLTPSANGGGLILDLPSDQPWGVAILTDIPSM